MSVRIDIIRQWKTGSIDKIVEKGNTFGKNANQYSQYGEEYRNPLRTKIGSLYNLQLYFCTCINEK